ncbi:MAG: glutamyl-tRNA reductase [Gemmatimonadetes bacterium]|uniref:Glutamyl-tRNA reductase n=1 Tax=Candidatus Kutchimonas denitrificans TaxID=3056748 RepID=A0AAE5CB04_9BACT|nr:glutamyl-tRNA reductase [Gemmatimonadota bacterium]NIR73905.1 glutamyl-tRNA reductase [Candidatus Kutchimonas denitrificans]NIR99711.1 glutamyl-tRNA reductase [Gemmatimonadota bacterium]NIT65296.1 glutamyl-tRNA reductase [Gemmatimonadota bacterium]NIW73745.1 glutamyl-tRNA reductase [Gemmatimonadota bacterium]
MNHRTAPIEIRERFAFSPDEMPDALAQVLSDGAISEAALISTCNRTEFYLHLSEHEAAVAHVVRTLADQADSLPKPAERYIYVKQGLDAVEHLYRVTSGLDSMVLGEVQIQGQVRDAYEVARSLTGQRQAVRTVFNRLFQSALSVGGRVRSETRLSEGAASVPSAAVELARKIFGSLRGRRGMVLGAGNMGELTLECLVSEGVSSVIVTSRSLTRAQKVAGRFGGSAVSFSDFWEGLPETDIVITSTSAPHAMITLEDFQTRMPKKLKSPLFIVDIAIPRDVESEIGDLPNVFLYTIDDLQQIVTANYERRKAELPKAEKIIEHEVEKFWRWYSGLRAVPFIKQLRNQAEQMRQSEVDRTLSELDHLSDSDREKIQRLSVTLLKKFLHQPTARIRAAAEDGREHDVLEAARFLFDVEGESKTEGSK